MLTVVSRILPDPLFRLKVKQIHRSVHLEKASCTMNSEVSFVRSKHGSDTHVFDQEGRFHPQLFENIFTKFDKEKKGGLTFMDGMRMLVGGSVCESAVRALTQGHDCAARQSSRSRFRKFACYLC